MRTTLLAALMILVLLSAAYPQGGQAAAPISLADLDHRPVIGQLGLPLGTAAEIEATVIDGETLNAKAHMNEYLLRVTHLNGKNLDGNPVMEFHTFTFVNVHLPRDGFELYELKNGKKTGSLGSDEKKSLEKGFVGKTERLLVYETGSFDGRPELPAEVPSWQDHAFGFSTSLQVVAERN